jgi:single-stranded-DNA-specific exonuclease
MKIISRSPHLLPCHSATNLALSILDHREIAQYELFDNPGLKQLDSPFSLMNIHKAVDRLVLALERQELIAIISDHDCDGQTACAVLTWSLLKIFEHPQDKLLTYIGHRTEEGYGVSTKLCERILTAEQLPTILITADCGSSDHETIHKLAQHGIDVIVTDHHTVPERGVPDYAYTVINPNQPGCLFPDKNIAGCFVAWFVMAAVRNQWQIKHAKMLKKIAECLDFVAVGTMSDCVSLKTSINNRIALRYGLKAIREQRRPCWRILRQRFREFVHSDFLVFKLIPLINADGRLFDALNGIKFLLAADMVTAQERLAELIQTNDQRRYLQKQQMTLVYKMMEEDNDHLAPGLILNLGKDGHHGIHGVTASRLLAQHQKLSILFSQHHQPGLLSGSARSPEGISLRFLLDSINTKRPGLLKRYGGHHQAAGLAIAVEDFKEFKEEALYYLRDMGLDSSHAHDITFDGVLPKDHLYEYDFFLQLEHKLEPFGKDFQRPCFGLYATLDHAKTLGEEENHLQLMLKTEVQTIKALFFFVNQPEEIILACEQEECLFIGEFMIEEFQKKQQLSFFLKGIFIPSTKKWWDNQQEPKQATLQFTKETKFQECTVIS